MRISTTRAMRYSQRWGLWYADKDGSPILIEKSTWRDLKGFFINRKAKCVWVEFRRYDG